MLRLVIEFCHSGGQGTLEAYLAFISRLWEGTYEEKWFVRNASQVVFIPIGWDDANPISYDLMVSFDPSDHGDEYIFALIRTENEKEEAIFDSTTVSKLIPKHHRQRILKLLLDVTSKLLRLSNSPGFFMTTFMDDLPPKALEKYEAICDVFRRHGYDVTKTEPRPGTHFWRMNRRKEPPLAGC